MHIKGEGMTQFDICHVFVENSVNSEFCFFWALLKPVKIWNLSINAHVWAKEYPKYIGHFLLEFLYKKFQ